MPLASVREGGRYEVAWMARPQALSDASWRSTLSRLEELGLFPGETVEKVGSLGPLGAVIVKAAGSRVAVSRDIAASILVTPLPQVLR